MIMESQSQDETARRRRDDSIMTDVTAANAPARAKASGGLDVDGGRGVVA